MIVVNFKNYGSKAALDEAFGSGKWLYIGRPNSSYGLPGSPLANPFKINQSHSRLQVIQSYRSWLWNKIKEDDQLIMLELQRISNGTIIALVCWCSPLPCHGDVVISAVNWIKIRQ